jgi:hypothetical protein
MSNKVDILQIDEKIRKKLLKQTEKIPETKLKLKDIEKSLKTVSKESIRKELLDAKSSLEKDIENYTKREEYNFYVLKTISLIENYKKILNTPVKLNFMGKKTKKNKKKIEIEKEYLKIASSYIIIKINEKETQIKCVNCNNSKNFEIVNYNTYICTNCYSQQNIMKHNSSYNDIDRVNISAKYMYDRKVHFRDCIKQYQGKQNCTIPEKVYTGLEEQFILHHILIGDKNTNKKLRFKNVTKNHILLFLKVLGFSNHYENVNLIHYTFTGKKPDDISYLEDKLLDDFDKLTEMYDKKFKHIKRKNFINTQYVLYQLLRRHKHKCKKEEFIILKTIDRKFFHDEVCKKLFQLLGWNHTPFY